MRNGNWNSELVGSCRLLRPGLIPTNSCQCCMAHLSLRHSIVPALPISVKHMRACVRTSVYACMHAPCDRVRGRVGSALLFAANLEPRRSQARPPPLGACHPARALPRRAAHTPTRPSHTCRIRQSHRFGQFVAGGRGGFCVALGVATQLGFGNGRSLLVCLLQCVRQRVLRYRCG